MKYIFLIILTVSMPARAMRRGLGRKATAAKHSAASHSVLDQLSLNLSAAIRDLKPDATQAVLQRIGELNKKPEDLRCLELKATAQVQALLLHYKTKSEEMAKLLALEELNHTRSPDKTLSKCECQSLSSLVIDNHTKSSIIHDSVFNFFTGQWRAQEACLTGIVITPTPPPSTL